MKKYVSLFLTLCMLLTMIPLAAMTVSAEGESAATGAITPDTSWYDDHKEDADLYINDAADLLGFSKLISTQMRANGDNSDYDKVDASLKIFAGKTVHIMADIDLNPGWTASATKPTNVWLNAAYHSFTGMIDGHGHTISGIYYDYSADGTNHVGIFGNLHGGTAEKPVGAKNLAVVNSYVAARGNTFGGLFGAMPWSENNKNRVVLIDNVYVDIMQVSYFGVDNSGKDAKWNAWTGGIIGYICPGVTVTIKNSIVNSTIKTAEKSHDVRTFGGFVGYIHQNANVTIEDCLFTGMLSTGGNRLGGFVAQSLGNMTIKHCLEAGTIDPATWCGDFNAHGSLFGHSESDNNKILNCIYTDISYSKGKGQSIYGETNSSKKLSTENLKGNIYVPDDEVYGLGMAEKLTTAGMTNWTVTTTGCPMPRSMVIMFPWLVEKDDAAKTPVTKLAGYQVSDATDGKMNLRLVATLKFPEGKGLNDYTAVGFRVVANYGNVTKSTNISTTEVYTGVAGYTKGGTTVTEYTATSLGGDYVFVLPCQGVPADQTITMEVTTYYVTTAGETLGATVTFTVNASGTALPQ